MDNTVIPTAEEALSIWGGNNMAIAFVTKRMENATLTGGFAKQAMIEYAKLHVQAALEAAFLDSKLRVDWGEEEPEITDSYEDGTITITISKDSILNAYPLENIK